VIPNGHDRKNHPATTNHEVEDKEQEVPVVLHAEAVIDPGTVVVHHEHTPIAHSAVVRPTRLNLLTLIAVSLPDRPQLIQCLGPIAESLLDLFGETLKAVTRFEIRFLPRLPVFVHKPQFLNLSQLDWPSRFNRERQKMIEDHIETQDSANEHPQNRKWDSESLVQDRDYGGEKRVDMQVDQVVEETNEGRAAQSDPKGKYCKQGFK